MYTLTHPNKSIIGTIELTASKSISNRLLIIQALCREHFDILRLATAQDTQTLQHLLNTHKQEYKMDVGPAGTVMRFLTAFLAIQPEGEWQITGSARMLKRPIGPLAEALHKLGAYIDYVGEIGYPPLRIKGRALHNKVVEVDGSVSSQYITALLLIAPYLTNGLALHLKGNITSKPYIAMTLALMKRFGAKVNWQEQVIHVAPTPYTIDTKNNSIIVEADWSGASYWYAITTLSNTGCLTINGLQNNSLQGDSVLVEIFDKLGVQTTYTASGIQLTKKPITKDFFEYDFTACPDIAQTVAIVVAGLGLEGRLTGLHTLKIKETDRIKAIITELNKLGYNTETSENETEVILIHKGKSTVSERKVSTYEDHRMAMAFAPLALVLNDIQIEHPEVVNKSYPEYWEHLKSVGFHIA